MILDIFTKPETVTCVLCRARVSIKKGDKARFFNHISHDHEVHYNMNLFYVVSFLSQEQIETVIDIIDRVKDQSEESQEDDTLQEPSELSEEVADKVADQVEEEEIEEVNIKKEKHLNNQGQEEVSDEEHSPPYLQIIKKHYQSTNFDQDNTKELQGKEKSITSCTEEASEKATDLLSPSKRKQKCSECNLFVSKKNMGIHMKSKHKPPTQANGHEVIPCSLCDKRLRRDNLKRHLNIVHKIGKAEQKKLNLDEIEGKKSPEKVSNFSTEKDVELEIKRETLDFASIIINKIKANESPKKEGNTSVRKCKLCSKIIKRTYYRRHLRRHKNDKSKAKHSESKILHNAGTLGVVTGLEAVSCELCLLSFSKRKFLLAHLNKIHEGDVSLLDENLKALFSKDECKFDCKECSLKFINESCLSHHVKRKHGTGFFACEFCGFKLSSDVRRKHHQSICMAAPENQSI